MISSSGTVRVSLKRSDEPRSKASNDLGRRSGLRAGRGREHQGKVNKLLCTAFIPFMADAGQVSAHDL